MYDAILSLSIAKQINQLYPDQLSFEMAWPSKVFQWPDSFLGHFGMARVLKRPLASSNIVNRSSCWRGKQTIH